jgi:hypothetical protein
MTMMLADQVDDASTSDGSFGNEGYGPTGGQYGASTLLRGALKSAISRPNPGVAFCISRATSSTLVMC